ncbi:bifunctional 2',3'-cyclic-nucleotide 2'-phosphodiesterase/3'-nucleotidase [Wielerella bovis]|uniref:bifunctional 2',3'-cyclic-nucleotide 2'-phosphodiesterase/3'-nucleotidase n=1 Tax=Wielerella bovis TaxID=2917790 RepID=UPI002018598C|nr:bifunctional 2',3'-cyclic-nucleotide 2'-phosphodiesterase/3'-nucleotidase [Wielerella bovis]ULJ65505.1 bifunctional 2',3'-cyclic-nucleotide 2'-phosphodiesterase/3'-nucleotidase [Wielerella bovis]ULJ66451.1 bifunctional 2',3'-cyclic-nucleotide 2'-phosphodiesterase/3'-nucleotidase [Wielerella bovis]
MKKTALTLVVSALLAHNVAAAPIQFRIIETSDIHTNLTDFDYYKDQANPQYGLTRTATLINQAKQENPNHILLDNGDLIQGAPMGDFMASKGLVKGEKHPAYLALEHLGFHASTLGNHEFNFGLDFLHQAMESTHIPILNANVVDAKTGKNKYTPFIIYLMNLKDQNGKQHNVKVGILGLVTPQILQWDKKHLEGKVLVHDIVASAKKWVPHMKQQGADVVIVLNHSGLGDTQKAYQAQQENTTYELSKIAGVDAVAFGHAHGQFPSEEFANLPAINIQNGTIHGKAATMPGQFGSHIGIMDLTLDNRSGKWQVVNSQSHLRPIYDSKNKKPLVENDPQIVKLMQPYHEATRQFVGKPIGKSSDNMFSFLALVQDDPTMQIVSQAQIDYVKKVFQDHPKYKNLPVLSAVAPFKAGGRKNDPNSYTEVHKGTLTFRNAADLYLYPNTLYAVKVSGKELREWLECSAGMFNHIDVNSSQPQALLNWNGFRTYNFDVIDGVEYEIDVSQPARYDGSCKLVNSGSRRIQKLTHQGKAVKDSDEFIVATNNYRATGGSFAGTGDNNIIYAAPDENRQVLAQYISQYSQQHGEIRPNADQNWTFKALPQPNLHVYFETANSELARQFIKEKAVRSYTFEKVDETGFAVYRIDLSGKKVK